MSEFTRCLHLKKLPSHKVRAEKVLTYNYRYLIIEATTAPNIGCE